MKETTSQAQTFRQEYSSKIDPSELGWQDMDWTDLARGTGQWMVLVNMTINFGFCKMLENY
jgi:hypothetical protein